MKISKTLYKKYSFPLRISSVNVTKSAGNLVTFTEEILNGKPRFLCSETLDKVLSVQWWDSNGNSIFRFLAPDITTEYNLAMGLVGLVDILIPIYHAPMKMKRGQLQVLMHFDA